MIQNTTNLSISYNDAKPAHSRGINLCQDTMPMPPLVKATNTSKSRLKTPATHCRKPHQQRADRLVEPEALPIFSVQIKGRGYHTLGPLDHRRTHVAPDLKALQGFLLRLGSVVCAVVGVMRLS